MKKLLYIFLTMSIIFSACKKEDDNPPNSGSTNNTSASILGSWDFTELHQTSEEGYYHGGYPNGTKIITHSSDVLRYPGDPYSGIESVNWTFLSNGYITETFKPIDYPVEVSNYIYEKSGNTLIIDTNNIWSIITLSSSKLTIDRSWEDTVTYWWDPNNDTIYFGKGTYNIKWDRSSISEMRKANGMQSNKYSFFKTFIDRKR